MRISSTTEFPTRRETVVGVWQPLYIEPMVGSGERICVAMIASSKEEFCVVPVAGIERLGCLYGKENARFIQLMVDEAIQSLELALGTASGRTTLNDSLNGNDSEWAQVWSAPFEGMITGPIHPSTGNSIEEIARYGLMMCASLTEKAVDTSDQSAEAITRTRLESSVRQIVTSIHPFWKSYFNIARQLDGKARSVTFGFVGQNIAGNFATLSPTYLEANVKFAKGQLWDLAVLRERFGVDSVYREERKDYEVFIHAPPKDDIAFSPRQHRDIGSAIHLLELESQRLGLNIFAHNSIQEIATHLIRKESA